MSSIASLSERAAWLTSVGLMSLAACAVSPARADGAHPPPESSFAVTHGHNPLDGLPFAPGAASTLFVDRSAPEGGDGQSWATAFRDLQAAIAIANADPAVQRIHVAEGAYTPDSGTGARTAEFVLVGQTDLQLLGGFPAGGGSEDDRDPANHATVLSGDLAGDDTVSYVPGEGPVFQNRDDNSFRVLGLSATSETVVVDGFTIEGGSNLERGGGIAASASLATLRGIIVTACDAAFEGAGLFVGADSDLRLESCRFSLNSAGVSGGGAYIRGSTVALVRTVFEQNAAQVGGGLTATLLTAPGSVLDGATFSQNHAAERGGGAAIDGEAPLTVIATVFDQNSAADGGGAFVQAEVAFETCEFMGNSAAVDGGGLLAGGACDVSDSRFDSNTAGEDGGGARIENLVSMVGCVFHGNTAGDSGGGLSGFVSREILRSEFRQNHAFFGGGFATETILGLTPPNVLYQDLLIENNTAESAGGGGTVRASGNAWARLSRVNVRENHSDSGSGGLFIRGLVRVIDSTIESNSAADVGGGISIASASSCSSGAGQLERCVVRNNAAGASGGGVYAICSARMFGSVLSSNSAQTGGALAGQGNFTAVSAEGCRFSANTATESGGALSNVEVTLDSCVIDANTAAAAGGAADNISGDLSNCSIVANTADATGGVRTAAALSLNDCIVWQNVSQDFLIEAQQLGGTGLSVSNSIIQGLALFTGNNNAGDDPLFADAFGPDGIAGTGDEDFTPRTGSPAIDAGSRSVEGTSENGARDATGRPRFSSVGGSVPVVIDRGAVEAQDCDADGVSDRDAIGSGIVDDCNENGVPDACEAGTGYASVERSSIVSLTGGLDDPVGLAADDRWLLFPASELTGVGRGAVYAYRRTGDSYEFVQRITAPPAIADRANGFGSEITIASDRALIVGNDGGEPPVSLYRLTGDSWTLEHVFEPPVGFENSSFGQNAVFSGPLVLISAHEGGEGERGVLLVYRKSGSGWTLGSVVESPLPQDNGAFSFNVVADDRHVAVAEIGGQVRMYTRNGYSLQYQTLFAPSQPGVVEMGRVLDLEDGLFVAANPDRQLPVGEGVVMSFREVDGEWVRLPTIRTDRYDGAFNFGSSISLSGERVAVTSSPVLKDDWGDVVRVFRLEGDTWLPLARYSGRRRFLPGDIAMVDGIGLTEDAVVAAAFVTADVNSSRAGYVAFFETVDDQDGDGVPDECAPTCGLADLADPFGVLDLADLVLFVDAFTNGDTAADVAAPFGLLDLADITAFVAAFSTGCP